MKKIEIRILKALSKDDYVKKTREVLLDELFKGTDYTWLGKCKIFRGLFNKRLICYRFHYSESAVWLTEKGRKVLKQHETEE